MFLELYQMDTHVQMRNASFGPRCTPISRRPGGNILKRQLKSVPALICLLFCGVSALEAQNSLAINPVNIFMNGTIGGPAVQQTFAVTSSPVATVPFTATIGTASWLTIAPSSGTTPSTLTLTANPAGLAPGVYSVGITLGSSSAAGVTQLVVFTVNNPTTPLVASPGNLVFTYQPGSPLPPAATINITSATTPPPYSVIPLSAPWLLIGQTGSSVTVAINPGGLTPGQAYIGGVQITPSNGLPPVIVPVVLYYYLSPQIGISPSTLAFNYQIGAVNNTVQKTITITPAGTTFTATATVPANTPQWLTVSPTSGTGNITVNVLPAGLPVGTYQASVTVTAAGSNPVTVPVSLNVSAQPLLDLSVSSLTYTYQVGSPNPPDQSVTLTSTTPGLAYTVAASSQGNWLSVNVFNALTGNPITVSANPGGLPPGTYTGTLTFNAVGAGNNPLTLNVTLNVSNNPTLNVSPNPVVFNYEVGQSVPAAQTISITANGAPLTFTVTSSGVSNGINWLLTGSPSSTTTPATFTAGVNPGGLVPGTYTGSIQLTAPGAAPLNVPVTLNVSTVALLNLPASINFTSTVATQPGQAGPSQNVTVTSTGEPVTYSVTSSTSSPAGGNWLVVGAASGPASNTIPSSFIVAANPSGLLPGTYKGSLLVHASNGTPDTTIPVTYTITSGNINVSPATLSFTQTANGPAPAAQNITINSTGVPVTFSVLTTVSSSVNWLSATPTSGSTPGTVSVSVNSGSLQPGNYTGAVSITSPAAGNSPQTVTVNLTVGQSQNISVSTASLSFSSQVGSAPPATQPIGVTASAGSLPFTATTSVTTGGTNWLSVSPTSGTATQTATNLTVSVNPQNLAAGTYTGTVTITGQGASNGPQSVVVNLVVTAIPTPVTTTIENAASLSIGPVAPGEIITILGTNLGPVTPVTATASAAGFFPTTLSETQVLFDNIPGALLYTSATQINVAVPYEIAGRATTLMQVVYRNTPSSTVNLQVAPSAPGIFLLTPGGQAAAFNADGSLNGPATPAIKGTPVVLFGTGEGATTPAGVTGRVIPVDPTQLKHPVLPVTATIGGVLADVQYVGSAPGLISGAFQINLLVPATAPSGGAVPVVVTVGTNSSQGRATIAIQ